MRQPDASDTAFHPTPNHRPRLFTTENTERRKSKKLRVSISSYSTDEVQADDILQLFHFREFPCFPWFLMNNPGWRTNTGASAAHTSQSQASGFSHADFNSAQPASMTAFPATVN